MSHCKTCGASVNQGSDASRILQNSSLFAALQIDTLPIPQFCSLHLQQRLMAWQNERHLYKRLCALSGKEIISVYSPTSQSVVYDRETWWSDRWDPLEFGQSFDFRKNFTEQYRELLLNVPREALIVRNSENCEFNHQVRECKSCYMCSLTGDCSERCVYGYWVLHCTDTVDCWNVVDSELMIGCSDTYNSYESGYLRFCDYCTNCFFGYGLINCSNCIGCTNLRHKNHYIFNEPVSPEVFASFRDKLKSYSEFTQIQESYDKIRLRYPHRASTNFNVQNGSGDSIRNVINCHNAFDGYDANDCRNVVSFLKIKDCFDCYEVGLYPTEQVYQSSSVHGGSQVYWSTNISSSMNIFYSDSLYSCSDCWGCVGLRRKKNCILNKSYNVRDYEQLAERIINHMKETGEFGHLLPASLSPFGYNETVACDYFPLDELTTTNNGFNWSKDFVHHGEVVGAVNADSLPDSIRDETLSRWIVPVRCKATGKPFKIPQLEIDLCRKIGVPLSRYHPDERYRQHLRKRNPRLLNKRVCSVTKEEFLTTYDPKCPEYVISEAGYNLRLSSS